MKWHKQSENRARETRKEGGDWSAASGLCWPSVEQELWGEKKQ